jgi:hypothetical protein
MGHTLVKAHVRVSQRYRQVFKGKACQRTKVVLHQHTVENDVNFLRDTGFRAADLCHVFRMKQQIFTTLGVCHEMLKPCLLNTTSYISSLTSVPAAPAPQPGAGGCPGTRVQRRREASSRGSATCASAAGQLAPARPPQCGSSCRGPRQSFCACDRLRVLFLAPELPGPRAAG